MTRMAGSIPGIASFLGPKSGMDELGGQAINAAAEEHAQTFANNAHVSNAGLQSQQKVQSAGHYADYVTSAASAQASATTSAAGAKAATTGVSTLMKGFGGGGGLFG